MVNVVSFVMIKRMLRNHSTRVAFVSSQSEMPTIDVLDSLKAVITFTAATASWAGGRKDPVKRKTDACVPRVAKRVYTLYRHGNIVSERKRNK